MPDIHKNFAYSLVATAPSPGASGTSLVVTTGEGSRFPGVPFNATVWPAAATPIPTNAEIVRVTVRSTDTLTITRTQEGSSARTIVVGDQIAATITNKTLTDIETPLDPVAAILGTPDTAYEFDTTSLAGLTALGTPDAEDAHTTVPGHYYVRDDGAGWVGRYLSATPPFTLVSRVTDRVVQMTDGRKTGIFVGDSSPAMSGDADVILVGNASNAIWVESASSSNITSDIPYVNNDVYFAIRVNSSTDIDYLWSLNGLVWKKIVDSRNPSLTIATAGLAIAPGSVLNAAAYDYLRIWNSAKSFPGALA